MIKYQLRCDNKHQFDGWFPNIAEFERQQEHSMIVCPMCDSRHVDRDIMSPSVGKSTDKRRQRSQHKEAKIKKMRQQIQGKEMMLASRAKEILRQIRRHVEQNFENVGNKFVKEVRRAEKGDRDDRFYGTPSEKEVDLLLEQGVDLFHIPDVKEDA